MNLRQGGLLRKEKVIGQTKDGNGDATGSCDYNLLFNALTYDVEFSNSEIKECSANVIAENMHSQVDEDGCNAQILDSIVDYRKDRNLFDKSDMLLPPRVESSDFVAQPLSGVYSSSMRGMDAAETCQEISSLGNC